MMGEGRPTPAPPGIVECLIQACRDGGYFASWGPLEVGDRVRVLNGPFVDMIGEITRIDAAARVRVLFRMMNGGIGVSVPRSALMRTSGG